MQDKAGNRSSNQRDSRHAALDDEIMTIFSRWSNSALKSCLNANGIRIDMHNESQLSRELDRCLDGIIKEILTMHDEWLREINPRLNS